MTYHSDAKDNSINFEAVKIGIVQSKDGYVLKLSIHPNDIPEELLRSWVGARYVVAMVELNDQDEPKVNEKTVKKNRLVSAAAMLCKEERFWKYLGEVTGFGTPANEHSCRNMLCAWLDIESRSDLATNKEARERFDGMKGEFEEWLRQSYGAY